MGYRNGKYWGEAQDELMRQVFTLDKNSKEWLHAYRKVLPRLKKMGEAILRRYYAWVQDKPAEDLIQDAITHLIMHGVYNPEKPKLYSYSGTVIKRYFYTALVAEKDYLANTMVDKNYDINETPWVAEHHAIQPDFQNLKTERQEQLEYIIEMLDAGIAKVDAVVIRNVKRNTCSNNRKGRNQFGDYHIFASQGKERELCFLHAVKEYFNENFMETQVSSLAIADYVEARCEIPPHTLALYQNKYFGMGSQPYKIDTKTDFIDWTQRHGMSYLMDDLCPNETAKMRMRNLASRRKIMVNISTFENS